MRPLYHRRRTDPIIEALEERIALWARIPAINAEDMQVGLGVLLGGG